MQKKRLESRNTETAESLQKRLDRAKQDLDAVKAEPTLFDHYIVNDDLDTAYAKFVAAIADDLKAVNATKTAQQ